jgi:hypothetical protein
MLIAYITKDINSNEKYVSYIALDDISFSTDCRPPTIPVTGTVPTVPTTKKPFVCPQNQVACRTGNKCIPTNQWCDFTQDCSDNSDEAHCGTCDFKAGNLCDWTNQDNQQHSEWSVIKSGSPDLVQKSIPKTNSKGVPGGYFAIINTRGDFTRKEAIIRSPEIGGTSPFCKLHFSYHSTQDGEQSSTYNLRVTLLASDKITKKIVFDYDKPTNGWISVSVPLTSLKQGTQIEIHGFGVVTPKYKYVDVEIDDIQFVNCGRNAIKPINANLTCDFETDMCGWIDNQENQVSKLDWQRTNDNNIDPGYDHTSRIIPKRSNSGFFVYTRRNKGMVGNENATLISALPQSFGTYCVSFWYHMFGRDKATFELGTHEQKNGINPVVFWRKKTPQSNNWIKAQVSITIQKPAYIIFRAQLMPQSNDIIGIDDITFTNGACPAQPFCDFEVR